MGASLLALLFSMEAGDTVKELKTLMASTAFHIFRFCLLSQFYHSP